MPIIRLKGNLDPELLSLGLNPGDEIQAQKDPVSKVGGMHFVRFYLMHRYECSIWPDNYDIIQDNPNSDEKPTK